MYLGELIEFDSSDPIFNHLKNELTQRYIAGHIGYKKISLYTLLAIVADSRFGLTQKNNLLEILHPAVL